MPEDQRDNEKLIPEWSASANDQIGWLGVGIGLILAALLLFGTRCTNVLDRGDDDAPADQSSKSGEDGGSLGDLNADLEAVGLTDLDVSLDGRTAELDGTVPSEQYKAIAGQVALGQRGIDRVENNLKVDPDVEMKLDAEALEGLKLDSDADLGSIEGLNLDGDNAGTDTEPDDSAKSEADSTTTAPPSSNAVDIRAIRTKLADAGLDDVTAKLSGTTVSLTGTVPSADDRDEAEQIALDAKGVTDVNNEITVKATGTGEDPVAVERTILAGLKDAGIDGADVSVSGDTATLTGEVATVENKDDAEDIALSHPAIEKVDNKLTVPGAVGQDAAKQVIEDLGFDVDVLVKGSAVTLTGVVPTAADRDEVDKVAAAFDGIETVDNQLVVLQDEVQKTLSADGFDGVTAELDKYNVTLKGTVNSDDNAQRLETAVAAVPGIGEITNDVTVKTDPLEESLRKLFADGPVEFASGSANLTPAAQAQLDDAAEIINDAPGVDIEVAGYTDNVGDDNLNKLLSEARARAVVKYLVDQGVDPERIFAIGYGEGRPIASNETPEGRAKNRRIEFSIG